MAKVDVVRRQPDPPPVEWVTLTMTPEEATRVCTILGCAGGATTTGTAIPPSGGIYAKLWGALAKAGLPASLK